MLIKQVHSKDCPCPLHVPEGERVYKYFMRTVYIGKTTFWYNDLQKDWKCEYLGNDYRARVVEQLQRVGITGITAQYESKLFQMSDIVFPSTPHNDEALFALREEYYLNEWLPEMGQMERELLAREKMEGQEE